MKYKCLFVLWTALMLTQAASADNSLNNQASQTSDALKVQLADNLKTQLGLLDECHKTIPHQISQVTTLIDYLNQIVAKSQLLVDHETKLIQASASHENRQLNWAKNNIYSTNESLRLLIIVYKSLGGTETLDSSIRATPSPLVDQSMQKLNLLLTNRELFLRRKSPHS